MRRLIILSFLTLAVAGCKNERVEKQRIDQEVVLGGEIDQTKVSHSQTAFVENDEIAVWISDGATLVNQFNYVDKAKFVYGTGLFRTPAGQSKITFPEANSKLKYWAVYPYAKAPVFTGTQQFDWTLTSDQTSSAGYRGCDLMTAQNTEGVGFTDPAAVLQFYHRMSRAVVKIKSIPATYKGKAFQSAKVDVLSYGVATVNMVAVADDQKGAVVAKSGAQIVTVNAHRYDEGGATALTNQEFEAIIVPTTLKTGDAFAVISVTYGTGDEQEVILMQYTLTADKALASGDAVLLEVSISPSMEIKVGFSIKGWEEATGSGILKPIK